LDPDERFHAQGRLARFDLVKLLVGLGEQPQALSDLG
jgi:hypothetical protein